MIGVHCACEQNLWLCIYISQRILTYAATSNYTFYLIPVSSLLALGEVGRVGEVREQSTYLGSLLARKQIALTILNPLTNHQLNCALSLNML